MTEPFDFTAADTTVSAYARPTLLLDPVDSTVATLRTLDEIGVIDDLELSGWPGTVRVAGEDVDAETLAIHDRFQSWAEANGLALLGFEKEIGESAVSGEPQTVLHTPTMALAITVDDHLAGVFPHTDGEREYTVAEAIAAMRTDSLALDAIDPAGADPDLAACPACDGELITDQGVTVCRDCPWNGSVALWTVEGQSRVVRPTK